MTTFLLVHGAFRGGWAWDAVRHALEARGHEVLAPSLVGCGDRAGEPAPSLAVWVDQLAALVGGRSGVVAVGHSMGGVPVTALAAVHPEPLSRVAYLDAPEPLPGQRAVDLGPGPAPDPTPPRDTVLSAPTGVPRLGPTPLGPSLDPVPAASADVPRSYAFCAQTPPGYPCAPTRARLDAAGTPYVLLDSEHDAPVSAPGLVAGWLLTLAAEVAA